MSTLLSLAFAAGMLAPVNPCGFALLPAWIAYGLGDADTAPLPVRLARALRNGLALTIGFAGTLTAAGLAISAGARALITAAPWLGLALGATLTILGLGMLAGLTPRLRITTPAVTTSANGPSLLQLALFGAGYAAASLSCTFGVLLAVIAQAQATASYSGLLIVFAVYAAGAATVLILVAVATAAAGAALTRRLSAITRYVPRVVAVIVAATGAYLIWYWYRPATGHTGSAPPALAHWSAAASTWISTHTGPVAIAALTLSAAVTAAVIVHRLRRPTASTDPMPDCCAPSTTDTDASSAAHPPAPATPRRA